MFNEVSFFEAIEKNINIFSKRLLRFLAMYYPNSKVRRECWIKTNVILGKDTYLNPNITVVDNYQTDEILLEIGDNCSIAPGVVFAPHSDHNNSSFLKTSGILEKYSKKAKITVGNDVWIGANCTILAGVTIGNHCIIGANSLVGKDIPDFSLAYGVPCKVIKNLKID